jgi:hypothetical protein
MFADALSNCRVQVATFKPPVGVDRMERASKRAALAPGVRRWFRFDKAGRSSMITADKHAIAQQTGVQVRLRARMHVRNLHLEPPPDCTSKKLLLQAPQ